MSHDYDPSWDYEMDEKPLEEVTRLVDRFLKDHQQIFSVLRLPTPKVFFVTGLGEKGHLAKYINGTSSEPFIVLDAEELDAQADEYGVRLEDAVESTLLHEYGHAYLDATGRHEDMKPEKEERIAEKFAKTYWETRDLKKAMKVLS